MRVIEILNFERYVQSNIFKFYNNVLIFTTTNIYHSHERRFNLFGLLTNNTCCLSLTTGGREPVTSRSLSLSVIN